MLEDANKSYAIQLSPELHSLIVQRLAKLEDLTEFHNFLCQMPMYKGMHVIIFGSEPYSFKLLDKRQYEIRKNQNHLLRQYRIAIHNHARFINRDEERASELYLELQRLSQRISVLDQQIKVVRNG
ncbi:hypothetical protein [Acinetobacter ursingii]|uniref:hypothetical protein n=1 Tax=Acinetobacter ursingii TaxID=108980 RepID=UPI00124C3C71|nr:hypothetical protein [Acinetobacter ursingii]